MSSFLRLVQGRTRGRLKVYLGLAAGVGKTWRLLQEAHDLRRHDVDVLVGYAETHGRAGTEAQLAGLPVLPRRRVFYKGRQLEEFDLEAALQRRPQVMVVDELAHTNAPGSTHEKRWQDVEALLRAGISVLTAVNVQHLESLHDQVQRITGLAVAERVPDQVLRTADEVVNVDLTVAELRQRLEEGHIYAPTKVPTALRHFFRPENLVQLRELALREAANLVGGQIESGQQTGAVPPVRRHTDRLLACISANAPVARAIIRKASRLADRFGTRQWYVLYVQTPAETADRINLATQRHLLHNLQLATELGAQVLRRKSAAVVPTILEVAREKHATLLVSGVSAPRPWWQALFGRPPVTPALLRAAARADLDVYLVGSDGVIGDEVMGG